MLLLQAKILKMLILKKRISKIEEKKKTVRVRNTNISLEIQSWSNSPITGEKSVEIFWKIRSHFWVSTSARVGIGMRLENIHLL